MRNTIIGLILAAALIAGLVALSNISPPTQLDQKPADVAAQVQRGFVGNKRIGAWLLACAPAAKTNTAAPAPATADGAATKPAANPNNRLGRCRSALVFRRKGNPKQPVLILGFQLFGQDKHLALTVAMPPAFKKGDPMELRWAKKAIKLSVQDCRKDVCIAAVGISRQAETDMFSVRRSILVLPPGKDGKPRGVAVPCVGLPASVAAMRRAES